MVLEIAGLKGKFRMANFELCPVPKPKEDAVAVAKRGRHAVDIACPRRAHRYASSSDQPEPCNRRWRRASYSSIAYGHTHQTEELVLYNTELVMKQLTDYPAQFQTRRHPLLARSLRKLTRLCTCSTHFYRL